MSVNMKRIYEMAKAYDKKLLATDPRFQRSIKIIHEDGSVFFIRNAFLMKYKDKTIEHREHDADNFNEWLIFFSEHNGFDVFHADDIIGYFQFKDVRRIEMLEPE